MIKRQWTFLGMLGVLALLASAVEGAGVETGSNARVGAGDPGMAEISIESDESLIYVHEAKKVEVRARIPGASTEEGLPRWNLVQVGADGRLVRYVGILFFSPKKRAFFRKLELQEREPGPRYFEVVPDAELEPFVVKPRTRLVIEVAARPSLLEILRGVWNKLVGQIPAVVTEAGAAESMIQPRKAAASGGEASSGAQTDAVPGSNPCRAKIDAGWTDLVGGDAPAGAKVRKGARAEGGVFAALQASVDLPIEKVADLLWNPANIKNPRNTRIKLEELGPSTSGVRTRKLEVNLRPFLFVNLDWQELWQRRDLAVGESVRIEYQKSAGEEKLKHFCGWMEARRLGPSKTEVTLYEEIDSAHRTAEDVSQGHVGTIGMLTKTLSR